MNTRPSSRLPASTRPAAQSNGSTTASSQPKASRRQALRRLQTAWRAVWERATAEDLEQLARHAEAALRTPEPAQANLVQALTGGRVYSPEERLALEAVSQEQYFQHRRALLSDALTAPQVARLLGTSRQTPHDRVRSGALLAVSDRGGLRFPAWQFDPQGPDGILAGLPLVLRALAGVPPLAQASWFVRPNPFLDGRTPLNALKQGESVHLTDLARAVGVC